MTESNDDKHSDDVEQSENWTDELPISGRAASNIADEFDSVDELVEAYRQAEDLSDISYVGRPPNAWSGTRGCSSDTGTAYSSMHAASIIATGNRS